MLSYLGNLIVDSADKEASLKELPVGVEVRRTGNLAQFYGPEDLRQKFSKTSHFRGIFLKPSLRDRVLLLTDSQRILSILSKLVSEKVVADEVVLNGLTTNGLGHTLEIFDPYQNESLAIQVAADSQDPGVWLTWRISEKFPQSRAVLTEKSLPFPETSDGVESQWGAVAEDIFSEVGKWLKERL